MAKSRAKKNLKRRVISPSGLSRSVISAVETPAFIISEEVINEMLGVVEGLRRDTGCKILYALKPLVNSHVMRLMKGRVDGFAASSLFESRLAREVLGAEGSVHVTTPGFRPEEMPCLAELCDYVALNSLSQWKRYRETLLGKTSAGLRVNPQVSLVDDERYDPCRRNSKLGVPLGSLAALSEEDPRALDGVEGIHFHNNCDSRTYRPLLATVRRIVSRLDGFLERVKWINLGGGYLLEPAVDLKPLYAAVQLLRQKRGLEVFLEPGAALVRKAGTLVASVVDLFESDGATIALLDTTINHLPEVYEYQFAPDVTGDSEDGKFIYILAGSSCLAGDLFGEYAFDTPLAIGSRVAFPEAGAYSLAKAHMFNGINLPTVYSIDPAGGLSVSKRYTYEHFVSRFGGTEHADS
jgi:carboxynorspermidine decarboxylase